MRPVFILLTSVLLVLVFIGNSLAADCPEGPYDVRIIDMYSDIDSGDITIYSSIGLQALSLELQLVHDGEVLDTNTIRIDRISPGSTVAKVFEWDTVSMSDGRYTVTGRIMQGDCQLYSWNHSFVHGRQVIPRITANDLVANSEGASLIIMPVQPVIMDLEFMLVDGSDVIYSAREQKVALHTQPGVIEHQWNTLLANEKDYKARVKINMYTPAESVTLMESFTAIEDVFISDIYRDAVGASATIEGRSQVPFTGSLKFTVIRNSDGVVIESVSQRSPVLLRGDDETVETIWKNRLPEGTYRLTIEVMGNDGKLLDQRQTIIEAAAARRTAAPANDTGNESQQAPGFTGAYLLSALIAVALVLRIRSK
jgi:hypothetical protein